MLDTQLCARSMQAIWATHVGSRCGCHAAANQRHVVWHAKRIAPAPQCGYAWPGEAPVALASRSTRCSVAQAWKGRATLDGRPAQSVCEPHHLPAKRLERVAPTISKFLVYSGPQNRAYLAALTPATAPHGLCPEPSLCVWLRAGRRYLFCCNSELTASGCTILQGPRPSRRTQKPTNAQQTHAHTRNTHATHTHTPS